MSTEIYRSNEKASVLLNLLSDPAVIVDEKGLFLIVNDAFEEITGLKRRELIGKPFLSMSIVTAESKAILLENLKKRMQGVPVKPYEICFIDKTGANRCVEVKGKKVTYAEQTASLVVFHDITRRKENMRRLKEYSERMEALVEEKVKEIKESEEKFRTLAEQSPNMVFVNKKGRVVYANKKAEEVMGYTKEEFYSPSFNFLCLIAPESKEQIKSVYEIHVRDSKDSGPLEYRLVTKDGGVLDAIQTSRLIVYEGENAILGTVIDITERKKTEEVLRISEEKYRELINGMNDTAWVIDPDAKFIDVNDTAVKVLGYSREELLSMGPSDIDSSLSSEEISTLVKNMPADQVQVFETSHTTKDGRKIPVEISSSLVTYQGKQAVLSIARDITERKRMQSKLAEYSMKLERLIEERTGQLKQTQAKLLQSERMAAIGELAGMVGHDLRNPLTAIKNAVYYLEVKQGSCSDENSRKMLEIIDSAITHADKIIDDLQDYSREMQLELAHCSPRSILKEALNMIQIPDRVKIIDDTTETPIIRADEVKIVRVFINIIKNAFDAMPEGGTLHVQSTQINGNVKISFTDTGIGMPKKTLAKLFSPLITTKAQGMGFGLAICKRIVEAHQGKITVQSVEDKGTTVTITIPTEPKPKDETEETWINVPDPLLSTTKT